MYSKEMEEFIRECEKRYCPFCGKAMTRTMNFNITSDQRKEFAQTVAEYFHAEAKYTMPGFRYVIDDKATVMKDGTLVIKDETAIPYLLDYLGVNGFKLDEEEEEETAAEASVEEAESEASEEKTAEEETDEPEQGEEEEPMVLQISVPNDLTNAEFERLNALVSSKATILKKVLGTDGLIVKREDGKVCFDGFPAVDSDHHHAYAQLVTKMIEFAKNAKRINAEDKATDNEKYSFRGFLIRLGMNGTEFKQARKILLENLSGNTAFKTDDQLKAHSTKWAEKRKAAKAAEDAEEEIKETSDAGESDDENAE